MKKLIFSLTLIFAMAFCVSAQGQGQRFGSKQMNIAIETWKYIADNNKKDHDEWSKAVLQEFGITDEGEIRHAYVINARDSFNVEKVMNLSKIWIEKAFTTPGDSIVEYDVANRVIKARVMLLGMGDAYGFSGLGATASEAHVSIPLELTLQFKENRLRYDARINTFVLNSSDWVRDIIDKATPITDCYPIKSTGKHKDSYSRAFINGNAKCLTSCRDYIVFLNTHIGEKPKQAELEAKKKAEDDW